MSTLHFVQLPSCHLPRQLAMQTGQLAKAMERGALWEARVFSIRSYISGHLIGCVKACPNLDVSNLKAKEFLELEG